MGGWVNGLTTYSFALNGLIGPVGTLAMRQSALVTRD